MVEPFSVIHVSGDLRQALATAQGRTWIVSGGTARIADTRDIDQFFDEALHIEELEPASVVKDLDALIAYVDEKTGRFDTLHFLLHGMDPELSIQSRLSAIAASTSRLADPSVVQFLTHYLLRSAPPEWDGEAAAALAGIAEAYIPALFYLAAVDPVILEGLRARNPEEWPSLDARALFLELQDSRSLQRGHASGWDRVVDALGGPRPTPREQRPTFRWFIDQFSKSDLPAVWGRVVKARFNDAVASCRRHHLEEGLVGLRQVMSDLEDRTSSELWRLAVKARTCEAAALMRTGRISAAIQSFGAAIRLSEAGKQKGDGHDVSDWKAMAAFGLAWAHWHNGDDGQAAQWFLRLDPDVLSDAPSPRRLELGCKALYNLAHLHLRNGEYALAVEMHEKVEKICAEAEMPVNSLVLGRSYYNKAWALESIGDAASAMESYASAIEICTRIESSDAQFVAAKAYFNIGVLYDHHGQHRQAITFYETLASAFGEGKEPDIHALVAAALFNRGVSFAALGDLEQAIHAYGELEQRYAQRNDDSVRIYINKSRDNRIATAIRLTAQRAAPQVAPLEAPRRARESSSNWVATLLGGSENDL